MTTNKGLEELKRLAYEIACCRCQYYTDKKCTNKSECIWLDIEKELKEWDYFDNELKKYHITKPFLKQFLDLLSICNSENGVNLVNFISENNVYDFRKKLKALEIISQNFKLVGNCLHAKNKYAESGWVFVKELEDEEEHKVWKEVLYEKESNQKMSA